MALVCESITQTEKKETKAAKKMRRKYLVKILGALTSFGALEEDRAKDLISRFDSGYNIEVNLSTSKSRLKFEIDSKKKEFIYI